MCAQLTLTPWGRPTHLATVLLYSEIESVPLRDSRTSLPHPAYANLSFTPTAHSFSAKNTPGLRQLFEHEEISGEVDHLAKEHPKQPILDLVSTPSEVSGTCFWGFFCRPPSSPTALCTTSAHSSGMNLTPPDLLQLCDEGLCQAVRALDVSTIVGVGRLAEQQARQALVAAGMGVCVEGLMHPSPSNPQANKGWEPTLELCCLIGGGVGLEMVCSPASS
ncbi:hypothetical protein SKAU_G00399970 [Synaphobranchus kaupii]|uniref:Uncharacterized protein n=1 Tax=Synaphobranchus kaupii TaxID=118154 RepID=A0A9Q1E8W9_SYNKA|nr:hypothetical protein SKAU_G00399970 [Synaphobranchus kaupii]